MTFLVHNVIGINSPNIASRVDIDELPASRNSLRVPREVLDSTKRTIYEQYCNNFDMSIKWWYDITKILQ